MLIPHNKYIWCIDVVPDKIGSIFVKDGALEKLATFSPRSYVVQVAFENPKINDIRKGDYILLEPAGISMVPGIIFDYQRVRYRVVEREMVLAVLEEYDNKFIWVMKGTSKFEMERAIKESKNKKPGFA